MDCVHLLKKQEREALSVDHFSLEKNRQRRAYHRRYNRIEGNPFAVLLYKKTPQSFTPFGSYLFVPAQDLLFSSCAYYDPCHLSVFLNGQCFYMMPAFIYD